MAYTKSFADLVTAYDFAQHFFEGNVSAATDINSALFAVEDGVATYSDALTVARRFGQCLSDAILKTLSGQSFAGKTFSEAELRSMVTEFLPDAFRKIHGLVTAITSVAQDNLNKQAGIGLKSVTPEFRADKVDDLAAKFNSYETLDESEWVLDEPVKNASQSIVADAVKANAEFQYKSGLTPIIKRTMNGSCCDWCRNLAGTYKYPNEVPKDVYRRHSYCNCLVEYKGTSGDTNDVHSGRQGELTRRDEKNNRWRRGFNKDGAAKTAGGVIGQALVDLLDEK